MFLDNLNSKWSKKLFKCFKQIKYNYKRTSYRKKYSGAKLNYKEDKT